MKQIIAILLLTVFGLPIASPLFALSRSPEEAVPACCRRDGKHHCSGDMAATPSSASSVAPHLRRPADKCPFYPQATVAVHPPIATPPSSLSSDAPIVSHPCGLAQTESKWRIARDRSRGKRGPPSMSRL